MALTLLGLHAPAYLDPSHPSLARELAQDIRDTAAILRDYGFEGPGDRRWLDLCASEDFKRLLTDAAREWNAVDSTPKRIRHKAQASLEITVAELHVLAMGGPATTRLDAIKIIKSIAGFDNHSGIGRDPADAGGGFSITINMGDQTAKVTLNKPPTIEAQVEDAG